jgi:5-formyltetrahydrofolate cyclo-ligase
MTDISQQKATYRKQARLHRERRHIDESDFERVIDVFDAHFSLPDNAVIAGYWPKGREFDCRFLLDELNSRGHICVLPVIGDESRIMRFARWQPDEEMHVNKFGIFEPKSDDYKDPDIVLAPMLAFDQRGFRLGQGGGFYDATMADLKARKNNVRYIGLGYMDQAVLFKLPAEAHDIKLDAVLTPQGVKEF